MQIQFFAYFQKFSGLEKIQRFSVWMENSTNNFFFEQVCNFFRVKNYLIKNL